ncbi:MAG TPA: hypothetical protein VFY84_04995 [Jiangellales bacterium]|nr:hypothetical protein [Jiangellales bacterium]
MPPALDEAFAAFELKALMGGGFTRASNVAALDIPVPAPTLPEDANPLLRAHVL